MKPIRISGITVDRAERWMAHEEQQPDDEHLMLLSGQGDGSAFSLLVVRHWHRLHGWMFRLTHERQTAEDLTQETFLKAWKAAGSYRPGPGFRVWLFRIARNAWIDHSRRNRKLPDTAGAENLSAESLGPQEAAMLKERDAMLEQAVRELAVEYREPLLLRCTQSLTFAEIGQIMGVKEDTVRWRVYKARKLLLERLGTWASDRDTSE